MKTALKHLSAYRDSAEASVWTETNATQYSPLANSPGSTSLEGQVGVCSRELDRLAAAEVDQARVSQCATTKSSCRGNHPGAVCTGCAKSAHPMPRARAHG